MKIGWKTMAGILLSVFLVWYTLREVDLVLVWEQIRLANDVVLIAAIAVAIAGYMVRAFRWKVLLHPVEPDTGLENRFRAIMIGFMANNVLPARVGEFARAYTFSRFEPRVSASAAFGSLVVERVLDAIVLGGFLVGATLTPGFPEIAEGETFGTILQGVVSLLAVLLLTLAVLLVFPRPVVRAMERLAALLPRTTGRMIVDALEAFLEALTVIRSPWLLFKAFMWSVAFWIWHGLSFYLAMLAFGIDAGIVGALFTEAVVGFAVALPAAPGFFGTFHIGVQFALGSVYGFGGAEVLAFAYGYHLLGFIPVTLMGIWYVRSLGLSMAEVGSSETAVEEAVEEELEL